MWLQFALQSSGVITRDGAVKAVAGGEAAVACKKLEVCGVATFGETFKLTIEDNWWVHFLVLPSHAHATSPGIFMNYFLWGR